MRTKMAVNKLTARYRDTNYVELRNLEWRRRTLENLVASRLRPTRSEVSSVLCGHAMRGRSLTISAALADAIGKELSSKRRRGKKETTIDEYLRRVIASQDSIARQRKLTEGKKAQPYATALDEAASDIGRSPKRLEAIRRELLREQEP